MHRTFGKVFRSTTGIEYGVIREANKPFPEDLPSLDVLAEDESGNYFVQKDEAVYFWDHEICEIEFLSDSVNEFVSRCSLPEKIQLETSQVESAWIDPEFAKQFDIKNKP